MVSTCFPGGSFSLSPKTVLFLRKEDFLPISPEDESLYLFVLPHRELSLLSGCGCTPSSPSGRQDTALSEFNLPGPGRGLRMEKMLQTSQTEVNCSKMSPL